MNRQQKQEQVHALRVEVLGPELAAEVEEEYRQKSLLEKAWLRFDHWLADRWLWRVATDRLLDWSLRRRRHSSEV